MQPFFRHPSKISPSYDNALLRESFHLDFHWHTQVQINQKIGDILGIAISQARTTKTGNFKLSVLYMERFKTSPFSFSNWQIASHSF